MKLPTIPIPTSKAPIHHAQSVLPKRINRHNWKKKYKGIKEEVKYWLEVAALITSVLVLYLLWKQYGEMAKTTKIAIGQLQAMQGQFGAMTNQAAIMQGQLDEMQKDRDLDERAWLGITEIDIENSAKKPNENVFRAYFKNTGKTPAINVAVWIDGETFIPKGWNSLQEIAKWSRYTGMVAPDSVGSVNTSLIDDGTETSIENGMPYYVYGKIFYGDIFGNQHWTEFCYQMTFSPKFSALPITGNNICDDATNNQAH